MPQSDKDLVLPNASEIKSMEDVRDWMQKASGLISFNQSDIYEDLSNSIDTYSNQGIAGTKVFTGLVLGGNMDCSQYQMKNMVIENRTDDPTSPVEGQVWLRTDLI